MSDRALDVVVADGIDSRTTERPALLRLAFRRLRSVAGAPPQRSRGSEETAMADVRVRCVNRSAHACEHITHLGGEGWQWTVDQVVTSIEAGTNSFYTLVSGNRADVEVVQGPRRKYVRTRRDGTANDNLLALPSCAA
jgi:Protein of unknown function (DUF3892)